MVSHEELIAELKNSIVNCDEGSANRAANTILKRKIDPITAIREAVSPAARIVGERFEKGEYYLADILLAAEAMKSTTNILLTGVGQKAKTELETKKLGKVVIATVSGDVHDVGKNIVATMLSVSDFTVYDAGRDRPSMEIINRAVETGSDIIALSALMTTSMPSQKEVIDLLNAMGIRRRFAIIVGGGPTTKEWAREIGADGWAKDASEAVRVAQGLAKKRRR